MKRQYELTEEKLLEVVKIMNDDGGIIFHKLFDINFETNISEYIDNMHNYSEEIQEDIFRFAYLTNKLINIVKTRMPIDERIAELQSKSTNIDDRLANLLIEDKKILKDASFVLNELFRINDRLKENVKKKAS